MREPPRLRNMPPIPQDEEGPVFREPWEAQAFAMTLVLYDRGCFSWHEWAETLGARIKQAKAEGDPDLGDTYYRHWLAALETLVAEKGLGTLEELATLKDAWAEADHHRDFGQPIVLEEKGA